MHAKPQGTWTTYADIEFNGSPKHKHCRIAIAVRDSVNLCIPQDGADCCEETEQEDANETEFLAHLDIELEKNRQRDDGDDDVGNDGDNRVGCK